MFNKENQNILDKKAILCIWDRMGDYHLARVKALRNVSEYYKIYTADLGGSDKLYKWNPEKQETSTSHFVLSPYPVEKSDILGRCRKFIQLMREFQIQAICIAGYGKIEYLLFICIAKFYRKKVVLFAESWYKRNFFIDRFKGLILKLFCHSFFVSGENALNHFTKYLKIPRKKLRIGYSVVDNNHFKKPKNISIPQKKTILCVARLSEEKNLDTLIEAYKRSSIQNKYTLVIIGDGKEKNDLIDRSRFHYKKIKIIDWQNYQELPKWYHQASIFILPSKFEPWGLVVNEAMAASLPVIASKQCGCVPELVSEYNGYTFDAYNEDELIELFNVINKVGEKELLQKGANSYEKIQIFTPENWALNLIKLIELK